MKYLNQHQAVSLQLHINLIFCFCLEHHTLFLNKNGTKQYCGCCEPEAVHRTYICVDNSTKAVPASYVTCLNLEVRIAALDNL
jgi:hypothetical protein